jgi:hypothetical protein
MELKLIPDIFYHSFIMPYMKILKSLSEALKKKTCFQICLFGNNNCRFSLLIFRSIQIKKDPNGPIKYLSP